MKENELDAVELLRDRLSKLSQYVSELVQTPEQARFLSQTFAELDDQLQKLDVAPQENDRRVPNFKVLTSPRIITSFDDKLGILNGDGDGSFHWLHGVVYNITQKQQMEASLQYRVAFETLLTQISTQFINLTSEEIDEGINQALKTIGDFTFVDRVYVCSSNGKSISLTHDWCATEILSAANNEPAIPTDSFFWIALQLRQFKTVHVPCVDDLPAAAEAEKLVLKALGVQVIVAVPLVYDSVLIGTLCFTSIVRSKVWSEEDLTLLSTLGNIFANALARKYVESALRESEEWFRQLANNIDQVFWISCLEINRVIYVSPAYEKVWGRTCRSLYDNSCPWIDTLHPEELKRLSGNIEAWHQGEYPNNLEYRIVHPNGEIRWIRDSEAQIALFRFAMNKVLFTVIPELPRILAMRWRQRGNAN